jgi:hypothetical protein
MPKPDYPISFRADAKTRAALEKAAEAESRSVSSVINIALNEWLKARGFLKK